jgi:hypothetical protein
MIRGIRRTRLGSLLSLLTLVCVLSLSASTLLHSDADDVICSPVLVVHDHSAHRIGSDAGARPVEPEHCATCHWSSLRSVQAGTFTPVPADVGFHSFSAPVLPAGSATLSRQPARAPPSA